MVSSTRVIKFDRVSKRYFHPIIVRLDSNWLETWYDLRFFFFFSTYLYIHKITSGKTFFLRILVPSPHGVLECGALWLKVWQEPVNWLILLCENRIRSIHSCPLAASSRVMISLRLHESLRERRNIIYHYNCLLPRRRCIRAGRVLLIFLRSDVHQPAWTGTYLIPDVVTGPIRDFLLPSMSFDSDGVTTLEPPERTRTRCIVEKQRARRSYGRF